jgi:hypothetical protein
MPTEIQSPQILMKHRSPSPNVTKNPFLLANDTEGWSTDGWATNRSEPAPAIRLYEHMISCQQLRGRGLARKPVRDVRVASPGKYGVRCRKRSTVQSMGNDRIDRQKGAVSFELLRESRPQQFPASDLGVLE